MKQERYKGFKFYSEPNFDYVKKDESHIKLMLNKLKVEVDYGRIDNNWACKFINEMYEHAKLDYYPWSDKQKAKIEELFERY